MYPNKISSINQLQEVFMGFEGMLSWDFNKKFFKSVKKCDNSDLVKLFKQMKKVFENPYVGKHMSANRKGQLELYVANSYRLYYYYSEKDNFIVFHEFSHKDNQ